jgi:hypothetical protein
MHDTHDAYRRRGYRGQSPLTGARGCPPNHLPGRAGGTHGAPGGGGAPPPPPRTAPRDTEQRSTYVTKQERCQKDLADKRMTGKGAAPLIPSRSSPKHEKCQTNSEAKTVERL